jgi:hypothetical protein
MLRRGGAGVNIPYNFAQPCDCLKKKVLVNVTTHRSGDIVVAWVGTELVCKLPQEALNLEWT